MKYYEFVLKNTSHLVQKIPQKPITIIQVSLSRLQASLSPLRRVEEQLCFFGMADPRLALCIYVCRQGFSGAGPGCCPMGEFFSDKMLRKFLGGRGGVMAHPAVTLLPGNKASMG